MKKLLVTGTIAIMLLALAVISGACGEPETTPDEQVVSSCITCHTDKETLQLVAATQAFGPVQRRLVPCRDVVDNPVYPIGRVLRLDDVAFRRAVPAALVKVQLPAGQLDHRQRPRRRHPLLQAQRVQVGAVGKVFQTGHGCSLDPVR